MTSFAINEPFKRTPTNELSCLRAGVHRGVIFRVELAIHSVYTSQELFEIVLSEILHVCPSFSKKNRELTNSIKLKINFPFKLDIN